jgi:DNA polymerase III alpha subunit
VHAAGVIIAPGRVSDYVPVSVSKSKGEKVVTTQYDADKNNRTSRGLLVQTVNDEKKNRIELL